MSTSDVSGDRALLEAAAKAMGWSCRPSAFYVGTYVVSRLEDVNMRWNPLNSDGDALRLAASLGIDFYWHADGLAVARLLPGDLCEEWFAKHNGDKPTAMRRAIVRAAASLPT
jgi:hypothetical protein